MNALRHAIEGWMELQQPYWLLLFIPVVLGVWFRIRPYYFQNSDSAAYKHKRTKRLLTILCYSFPRASNFLVLCLIIGALADITRRFVLVEERTDTHRFLIKIDNSSSMYAFNTPLTSITCEKNADLFPRIHGACRALFRLIDEVERFALKKSNRQERDLIGIGQFATYSYVTAYPSQDYARLRERVRQMEFKSGVLGIYTNLHIAMWDLYLTALDRNLRSEGGITTHLSRKELRLLAASLHPDSAAGSYIPPQELKDKLLRIKTEMRDTVFIFITDALVDQMNRVLDKDPYSLTKQLELAAFLEIPVFFLSTDEYHPGLKRLARLTGFGPANGNHRGDFLVVQKEHDFAHIEELVQEILAARFRMTVSHSVERRESYAEWFAIMALLFAVGGLVWKKTIARSLTDI